MGRLKANMHQLQMASRDPGRRGCHLRLRKFVTCDSASLTSHLCHLRLEKLISCASSPLSIQTRKWVGWGGMVTFPNQEWHTNTGTHTRWTKCGVGWGVNLPWHLQSKNGTQTLAHIHFEESVGWGGMLPFPHTCKARMAHKHWHTYTLNKVWGGVGWDVNIPHIPRWEWIISIHTYIYIYNCTCNYIYSKFTQINAMISSCSVFTEPETAKKHRCRHWHSSLFGIKVTTDCLPPWYGPMAFDGNVEHIQWMSFKQTRSTGFQDVPSRFFRSGPLKKQNIMRIEFSTCSTSL